MDPRWFSMKKTIPKKKIYVLIVSRNVQHSLTPKTVGQASMFSGQNQYYGPVTESRHEDDRDPTQQGPFRIRREKSFFFFEKNMYTVNVLSRLLPTLTRPVKNAVTNLRRAGRSHERTTVIDVNTRGKYLKKTITQHTSPVKVSTATHTGGLNNITLPITTTLLLSPVF